MLEQRGEGCQNAQKQIIVKAHYNFVQTCSLTSIIMACIQYVVMIHLIE